MRFIKATHLLDSGGTEVDRELAQDPRPTVRVCPQRSGNYYMQVQMAASAGSYVYSPYRWPRGTQGSFGLEGLVYVRLAEVTALLQVDDYEPDPGFTPQNGQIRRECGNGPVLRVRGRRRRWRETIST